MLSDTGHNTASNEPSSIHYSNNAVAGEDNNQQDTREGYQHGYDPNQEQYMHQQGYYEQSQYEGEQYQQNYDNQYPQYGGDAHTTAYGEGQQYENYEEQPKGEDEKVTEEEKEESHKQGDI